MTHRVPIGPVGWPTPDHEERPPPPRLDPYAGADEWRFDDQREPSDDDDGEEHDR